MTTQETVTSNEAEQPPQPETVRCIARLGDTGGQVLSRPTRWGWWWHRIMPWEPWEPRSVMEFAHGGLCCPTFNMGDAPCVAGWDGEWVGPLMPPVSPNENKISYRRSAAR